MKEFLRVRLACPISKARLKPHDNGLLSAPCGYVYAENDFRVGLDYSHHWSEGQSEYEIYEKGWLKSINHPKKLLDLDSETAGIYNTLKISGDVLDVGGAFGFLVKQAGLNPQSYVSLDPIDIGWGRLRAFEHIVAHYSICESLARIRGYAEFLPFADASFDFVHMRSCIDHFANPKLALKEAFRVLKIDGKLIVGISLEGSYKKDAVGIKAAAKRLASSSPLLRSAMKLVKHDHHMFHPTRDSLISLVEGNGFAVEREEWQQAYHNVIYLQAKRRDQFQVEI